MAMTLWAASAAHAVSPAPPLPLSKRVEMSSHIFVGEIRRVRFISESGKAISAYQAAQQTERLSIDPIIETKIRVRETLLARKKRLPRYILFRHRAQGAGYFQTAARPQGLVKWIQESRTEIGKKFIFLTERVSEKGKPTFFVSSYGQLNRENLDQRPTVLKALKDVKAQ